MGTGKIIVINVVTNDEYDDAIFPLAYFNYIKSVHAFKIFKSSWIVLCKLFFKIRWFKLLQFILVEILDDISDIESEEEEGKGKVEIKKKDEIKENVDIKTEEEDEEENKEVEKKKENPSKPIEIDIDNTNKEEESKDDGEEKRDWKYSTEKAVFDILSDQELSDDAENDSRCVKCDLEHVKGKPCHFLLKNGKSTDDKERDKDIRGKKDSNQDKDIRNKLNSNRGRGKGGSGGGRGRGFVRQGIVGDTLRKVKLSGVRKVRVAPPRSDLEKGRAKSVRTLPPSLYNNPDALSSKSRLVYWAVSEIYFYVIEIESLILVNNYHLTLKSVLWRRNWM